MKEIEKIKMQDQKDVFEDFMSARGTKTLNVILGASQYDSKDDGLVPKIAQLYKEALG